MATLLGSALVGALVLGGCLQLPGPSASAEELSRLQRFRFAAATGEVSALRGGEPDGGPLVVFIHGTPGSAESWGDFLLRVPGGGEAVALDRPGFGESEPAHAVPELAEQAAAIEPLLGSQGGPGAILVGHSLGAPVAAWVAAEHPERVAGLVLISGSMDPELERLRWYNHVAPWTAPLLPRALANSNREVWEFEAQLEQLGPRLERVRAPVLILHGEQDSLVPVANAAYSAETLGGSESILSEVLPDAGHLLIWQEPAESRVFEALDAWIRGLPAIRSRE